MEGSPAETRPAMIPMRIFPLALATGNAFVPKPVGARAGNAARESANRVQTGMVGINVPIPVPMVFHSFGGWQRSLFGDMAVCGNEGAVGFYTQVRGNRHATGRRPARRQL
jgi:acyl-CoA reductase-like NAD-dependent aldehyde dehydrogenase